MRLCRIMAIGAAAMQAPARAGPDWPLLAGSAARPSIADSAPAPLGPPAWVFSTDCSGNAITFVGQAGPVVTRDLVLAVGSVMPPQEPRRWALYAVDRRTGAAAWQASIPAPSLDSWSTPAVDVAHAAVLVASGTSVVAIDLATGLERWQATLTLPVVNASPLVTSGIAPAGLGAAQRAFITEYDGFGTEGRLTCINTSPFSPVNPFDPGNIVWSVVIGASSGNTPAFADGTVFVASAGQYGQGPGRILAFHGASVTAPKPLWVLDNPAGEAFFGGVCAAGPPGGADRCVYAASYAFYGGTTSANLIKVDARDGTLRWTVPCNRTSSTPIALPDGRVIVSGGVRGYGTVPTVQLFGDQGGSALLLWDSAADTWNDANQNGVMDLGEFLLLGGWSHQPAASWTGAARLLYCGAVPANPGSTAACTDLYAIDLAKLPTAPGPPQDGYLAEHFTGAGSTPAIADMNLYTIGAGGLYAFGPPPPRCDVNQDGLVDVEDVHAWHQGQGQRDVDLDGQVTMADGEVLGVCVRYGEQADMAARGRP